MSYYEVRGGVRYSKRTGKPIRSYVRQDKKASSKAKATRAAKATSHRHVASKRHASGLPRAKGRVTEFKTAERKTNEMNMFNGANNSRLEIVTIGKDILAAAVAAKGGSLPKAEDIRDVVRSVRTFLDEVEKPSTRTKAPVIEDSLPTVT